MNSLIVVAGIFGVIGVSIAVASFFLNRDLLRLKRSAEKLVKNRFGKRNVRSSSALILFCSSNGADSYKTQVLLEALLSLFGCDLSENRLDRLDIMGSLFRVQREDMLDFERAWEKAGLKNDIEVLSDDLVLMLDNLINRADASKLLRNIGLEDAEEDKIKDAIMNMSVGDFLLIFSPYVKIK